MPAPNFRANSTYASATTSLTMTNPAALAANDILVLAVESANAGIITQGRTNLTNNGWARVGNSNTVYNTGGATANVTLDIWWRRVGANANTQVVLGDAGDHTLAVCAAFANVITTGDPWNATVNVSKTTASSQTTTGNVTTSEANTLIVTIIATPRDSAAATINASPLLIGGSGDDTELTERCDAGTTSGNGGTIGFLTHRKPTAGATANVRANLAASLVTLSWTGALIGIADPTFIIVPTQFIWT